MLILFYFLLLLSFLGGRKKTELDKNTIIVNALFASFTPDYVNLHLRNCAYYVYYVNIHVFLSYFSNLFHVFVSFFFSGQFFMFISLFIFTIHFYIAINLYCSVYIFNALKFVYFLNKKLLKLLSKCFFTSKVNEQKW